MKLKMANYPPSFQRRSTGSKFVPRVLSFSSPLSVEGGGGGGGGRQVRQDRGNEVEQAHFSNSGWKSWKSSLHQRDLGTRLISPVLRGNEHLQH